MALAQLPLGPLERAFVGSLQRLDPQAEAVVLAAAALTCSALVAGDVCLPLARWAGKRAWGEVEGGLPLPPLAAWTAALQASPLVGGPGEFAPLILENERLYLARYQAYEAQLAADLLARLEGAPAVDEACLQDSLARLFARNADQSGPDWQRAAAAQAVRRRLAVISGGPGTGKTTTVVRLLAALLEQRGGHPRGGLPRGGLPRGGHPDGGAGLAIGLAAPTGKAAARMAEAIRNAKAELPVSDAIKAALPEQARTLHRLLGSRGDTPAVRHHAGNPLALDVLVVDEASMVDLALMAKVLDALPAQARLILLGDKDQLSAVEAGAVFAELCEGPSAGAGRVSRLGEAVVLLTHSHRFAGDSGIGELARRINTGDAAGTLSLLAESRPDLAWQPEPTPQALLDRLEQGYGPYLHAAQQGDVTSAFGAFNAFRALTAQREGAWGVAGLNEALEARFKRELRLPARERWFPGRAVMVQQNDYALGLFNGDIGLCLASDQGLRVYFESGEAADQGYRPFAPARLPSHESAFAMTVHKSQGSEFSEVLLVLPEQPSPLLTRSLFYTGITRAKHKVEVWGLAARLAEAVNTRAERAAGLAQRLAAPAPPSPPAPHPAPGPASAPDQLALF
ncbi:MAG: exodeoxyribonuclease V subunit alpha [Pseudomonas sp.]|uniref:exodeoxyribonuclease V subunit alpha n=1 Tax=Pseudomonas sp. TaxID=306 RepID=UPI00339AE86C